VHLRYLRSIPYSRLKTPMEKTRPLARRISTITLTVIRLPQADPRINGDAV